jgi:hypothetical protein
MRQVKEMNTEQKKDNRYNELSTGIKIELDSLIATMACFNSIAIKDMIIEVINKAKEDIREKGRIMLQQEEDYEGDLEDDEDDEWSDVYSIEKRLITTNKKKNNITKTLVTYYQTYGGGPAGGYCVDEKTGDVYSLHSEWHKETEIKKMNCVRFEYQTAEEAPYNVARCRIINL